jgi:hypothetical protein
MLTHKEATNSDSQLIRFEFMELMMKIAIRKFCNNGPYESEAQALDVLDKDFLTPLKINCPLYTYDSQRWRVERYWNEPCDNMLKAYHSLF